MRPFTVRRVTVVDAATIARLDNAFNATRDDDIRVLGLFGDAPGRLVVEAHYRKGRPEAMVDSDSPCRTPPRSDCCS